MCVYNTDLTKILLMYTVVSSNTALISEENKSSSKLPSKCFKKENIKRVPDDSINTVMYIFLIMIDNILYTYKQSGHWIYG